MECIKLLAGRINISGALTFISHKMNRGIEMSSSEFSGVEFNGEGSMFQPSSVGEKIDQTVSNCADQITPSTCSCGGTKPQDDKVFVIGDKLWYDFGSLTRQLSIEDSFNQNIFSPEQLMEFLLGSKQGTLKQRGQMIDAESINWVLYQRGNPLYVIKPLGPFAEKTYKALLISFIENNDIDFNKLNISSFNDYYSNYGGTSEEFWTVEKKSDSAQQQKSKPVDEKSPNKAHQTAAPSSSESSIEDDLAFFLGENPSRASQLTFAGQIIGKTRLYNGEVVDVLKPIHRGMMSWNTAKMVDKADDFLTKEAALVLTTRLTSRIYEETLNTGKSPSDRAKNWMATHAVQLLPRMLKNKAFRSFIGLKTDSDISSIGVDSINAVPSKTQKTGGEFDVEIVLYDTNNMLRGLTTLTTVIDVSDEVPVTIAAIKPSFRRN